MKRTNTQRRLFRLLLSVMLVAVTLIALAVSVSAADLEWNLLTDTEAGYRVVDFNGRWTSGTEADGTPYMTTVGGESLGSALYIYDDRNILGSYLSFSLEGEFYFESFPQGLRDGQYTSEERPLSFLSWNYRSLSTDTVTAFNALRLDSQGYIHTDAGGGGKTDVRLETGKWYNIRCVFMPKSGFCEMFVDDKKVLDFNITRFTPDKYVSDAVRYFDGYYEWDATMKNLIVKTDSDYTIDLKRESSADYLGYQTTKPERGAFSARMVLGVNSTDFNRVGYEALVLTRDEDGIVQSESMSLRVKEIYETLTDAAGNTYNIKDLYEYNYAAAMEIHDLPLEPTGDFFELVLRPYVLGMDGIRRYGVAATFIYNGKTDDEGYPLLTIQTGKHYTVMPTDDTYIYKGVVADNGDSQRLDVRNPGGDNAENYRATYIKFTLEPHMLEVLETATAAKLRIYVKSHEENAARKPYDLILHSVDTGWDEHSLNYSNHRTLAPAFEELYRGDYKLGSYFTVDILPYLQEQLMYNYSEDGSLTVAFRLTNEAHSDTIAVFVSSKESDTAPIIELESSMYYPTLNLNKLLNKGYEPWGYAEHLVNEWFDEIVDKVYPKDENGNLIYHEIDDFAPEGYGATEPTGDFTKELVWKSGTVWSSNATTGYKVTESSWQTARFARTLSTLGTSTAVSFLEIDLGEMITEYDVYGGITNAGFTGTATGFFHTEKHGGRTYIIDPLGNPYFALGINTVVLGGTQNQKDYTIASYGLEEVYFERITKELKETGINLVAESAHTELLNVKNGLPAIVSVSTNGKYMSSLGRQQISEGVFPCNNTINVFDPDFVKSANETVAATVTEGGYADNPLVFGYTSDNELPSGDDILSRYLTLDPHSEPTNGFSYAVAWTWLGHRMGTECPTLDEYYAHPEFLEMNREFLGFIYARYYRVTREAIEAVDPNHMYLGSRINGTLYDCEDFHRAAGYYLDIITANLYGGLNPISTRITGFYRNSGIPFIVTEFFAKSMDAIDANGYKMANSTGAGILALTQQARADYYEHYSLAMLESKACVGWIWYCFRDNDPSVFTTDGTNRLIMLHCSYGAGAKANTFMDLETGKILTAAEVGKYDTVYSGHAIHSNQNVNKGLYNGNFSSVVTVYEYDKDGKLLNSMGYEVEHPEQRHPEDGTVLVASNGSGNSYTVGTAHTADGYTETILTVYKGQYVAFGDAIKNISDHLIGLVTYFDAE